MECLPGSYQSDSGKAQCTQCQNNTHNSEYGARTCRKCAPRLGSPRGSSSCTVCAEDYFLLNASATPSEDNCEPCPNGGICEFNTTIHNLGIKKGFWRATNRTSEIKSCRLILDGRNDTTCIGFSSDREQPLISELSEFSSGIYCEEGYSGPFCEIYNYNLQCYRYDLISIPIVMSIFTCVFCCWKLLLSLIDKYLPSLPGKLNDVQINIKTKMLFLNLATLNGTYFSIVAISGFRTHSPGVAISSYIPLPIFRFFGWNFISQTIMRINSSHCVGFQIRLCTLVGPFAIILSIFTLDRVKLLIMGEKRETFSRKNALAFAKSCVTVLTLMAPFAYKMLASVYIERREYQIDDQENQSEEYYLNFFSTQETSILFSYWVGFALWIILLPMGLTSVLMSIKNTVQSQKISILADVFRFTWQEYRLSCWYWEIIDTLKRMTLVVLITFIEIDDGLEYYEWVRVLIYASYVCVAHLCAVAMFQPYRRKDDYYFALIDSFIVLSCIMVSFATLPCQISMFNNFTQKCLYWRADFKFYSFFISYLLEIAFVVFIGLRQVNVPIVAMRRSTLARPNTELPEQNDYHVFMSHVWESGQAQTHAIVREMQLLFPDLKVWLDVDQLYDLSLLEESIASCAVFVLFYSRNYFRSKNCRREFLAAIEQKKPIIVLYEGDDLTLEEMRNECISNCSLLLEERSFELSLVLDQLFRTANGDGPILRLNEGSFSAAFFNKFFHCILSHLPHYVVYPQELEAGIKVPKEIGTVVLNSNINILICEQNEGSLQLANELKSFVPAYQMDSITIMNASTFSVEDRQHHLENDIEITETLIAKPTSYFLLYLNKNTFVSEDPEHGLFLTKMLQQSLEDSNVKLVLVHEKDVSKGACEFKEFYRSAPLTLINPPYNLFNEIAIPLYSMKEYREVGMKQLLLKMGAVEAST